MRTENIVNITCTGIDFGSENVFYDLGYHDAVERQARTQLEHIPSNLLE
jgi:hypothetical protein